MLQDKVLVVVFLLVVVLLVAWQTSAQPLKTKESPAPTPIQPKTAHKAMPKQGQRNQLEQMHTPVKFRVIVKLPATCACISHEERTQVHLPQTNTFACVFSHKHVLLLLLLRDIQLVTTLHRWMCWC